MMIHIHVQKTTADGSVRDSGTGAWAWPASVVHCAHGSDRWRFIDLRRYCEDLDADGSVWVWAGGWGGGAYADPAAGVSDVPGGLLPAVRGGALYRGDVRAGRCRPRDLRAGGCAGWAAVWPEGGDGGALAGG